MFDSSPVVPRKPIEKVCLPAGIVCKRQVVTFQPDDHHSLQMFIPPKFNNKYCNVIPNTIPGSPTETVTPLYDPPLLITQDSLLDITVTKGDTTEGNSRPQSARKIKKFYDPSTGSYMDGNPRGVLK